MARASFTLAVDNVGSPEKLSAPVSCKRIIVRENVALPQAQDLIVHQPTATSPGMRYRAGEEIVFENTYPGEDYTENDDVAYIESTVGATTLHGRCE